MKRSAGKRCRQQAKQFLSDDGSGGESRRAVDEAAGRKVVERRGAGASGDVEAADSVPRIHVRLDVGVEPAGSDVGEAERTCSQATEFRASGHQIADDGGGEL